MKGHNVIPWRWCSVKSLGQHKVLYKNKTGEGRTRRSHQPPSPRSRRFSKSLWCKAFLRLCGEHTVWAEGWDAQTHAEDGQDGPGHRGRLLAVVTGCGLLGNEKRKNKIYNFHRWHNQPFATGEGHNLQMRLDFCKAKLKNLGFIRGGIKKFLKSPRTKLVRFFILICDL